MDDYQRTVLEHYQLQETNPLIWPAEKDLSDASDDEDTNPRRNGIQKSKSNRYSALERTASDRRSLPGSQRTGDGVENLVQRDEPDPLGSTDSVVRVIRQQGLPIQDDPRLSKGHYVLGFLEIANKAQGIDSSSPLPLSHQHSSFPRSILELPPRTFSKDSMSFPDRLTRNPHL